MGELTRRARAIEKKTRDMAEGIPAHVRLVAPQAVEAAELANDTAALVVALAEKLEGGE